MTTYNVDARNGSDSNSGESTGKAWKTIRHVNGEDLDPGDRVLFRSGDVYTQTLEPSSSGSSSSPITFGSYGSGARPVFDGRGDLSFGIRVDGENHLRFQNLEVRDSDQGVMVLNSRGVQLVGLDVHDNARNGIHFKGSHGSRVEGGSSHENGRTEGTNLGHGVLMSNGASGNVVSGVKLYRNAEDGAQFGPDSGDNNRIRRNLISGNQEDGIDIKNGSNTLSGNYIHSNVVNAVFIHEKSGGDTTTLIDNHFKGAKGHALDITDGARAVSRDSVYENANSVAVRVRSDAKASHDGDTIINFGSYKGEVSFSLSQTTSLSLSTELVATTADVTEMVEASSVEPDDAGTADVTGWMVGTSHDDILAGRTGSQEIFGRAGHDVLNGGHGDDLLSGGRGGDSLMGGNGQDILRGGRGDDMLNGGPGADRLTGGPGDDVLQGGGGADTFVIGPDAGSTTIVDFELGADKIDLGGWTADAESALWASARQAGADVRLDLAGGGHLTVGDVELAALPASTEAVHAGPDDGTAAEPVAAPEATAPVADDRIDTPDA